MTKISKKRARRKFRSSQTLSHVLPGTLTADPEAPPPAIHLIAYGPQTFTEKSIDDPKLLTEYVGQWPVVWVNVDGLGDAGKIAELGRVFDLHGLALEDVLDVRQRTKVETYPDHLFIVAQMNAYGERMETEHLALFVGKNFVLTFQERPGDCFDPIRNHIRSGLGRLRQGGPDYLAYAILDAVVDDYFPALERLGEDLQTLEDAILARARTQGISQVHRVKRDLIAVRRAVWPLREVINSLLRDISPLVSAETRVYLRDSYDHAIQIVDLLETYRELAASLVDVYFSTLSQRMNEIMKVLTIISTIFIPMNLIAGIYGMNFNTERSPFNMPELNWWLGYPFALSLMLMLAVTLLYYFRRQGWLGRPERPAPPNLPGLPVDLQEGPGGAGA